MNLTMFSFLGGSGEGVLNPIYQALILVGPYAISVVLVLAIFYGIFLGVKYAQAEDEATKANMQKTLINFIIGAVVVVILIGVLAAIYKPLGKWITARD
jgi:prolipoprotein diacylglyceryltransferase